MAFPICNRFFIRHYTSLVFKYFIYKLLLFSCGVAVVAVVVCKKVIINVRVKLSWQISCSLEMYSKSICEMFVYRTPATRMKQIFSDNLMMKFKHNSYSCCLWKINWKKKLSFLYRISIPIIWYIYWPLLIVNCNGISATERLAIYWMNNEYHSAKSESRRRVSIANSVWLIIFA